MMNGSKNDTQKRFSIEEDQPSNWFEPLYASAGKDGDGVPWANMKTHPSFANWLGRNSLDGANKSALVVGCGMGDDAVELEALGFQVTAFDVSASAIDFCKARFPRSGIHFEQADLLEDQNQWSQKFDFVLEIFTVQALPPKYEKQLIQNITEFVALGGQLLVIAAVSEAQRSFENGPPWLLTPDHTDMFVSCGLNLHRAETEKGGLDDDGKIFVTTFTRPKV